MNNIARFCNLLLLLVTLFAFFSNPARGHSDDYFDSRPSPHGGQVRMSGAYHFELVIAEKSIVVYVTDHADQPIPTVGVTAKLEITTGGKKILIELTPAEINTLTADWPGGVAPELTARLNVKFPNEKAQKAKFTPFAKPRE